MEEMIIWIDEKLKKVLSSSPQTKISKLGKYLNIVETRNSWFFTFILQDNFSNFYEFKEKVIFQSMEKSDMKLITNSHKKILLFQKSLSRSTQRN